MTWKFHVAAVLVGLAMMATIPATFWLLDHSPSWLLDALLYAALGGFALLFAWVFGAQTIMPFWLASRAGK